ncbi:hypothetical protein A0H81_13684 [Grifola frondosa]|uniref:Cytochrome P450 n=1 Tax=Grifola frondosa TaxID=5627 RepID=A0A1C7LP43_GRIFR|nr:hypothetical protein A0H81_13684 [Grifola frondosa]
MAINSLYTFLLSLITVGLAFVLWKVYPTLLRPYTTSLRNLPGPPSPSWFFGNLKQIWNAENSVLQEEWVKEYGPNIMYRGFFNVRSDRLCTMDTRALNHILTHSNEYQKPEQARGNLARILGKGVLFTEGEQHRQQRRIMNPAFGPAQIRELTEIFVEKAIQASAAQGVLLCDLSFVQLRDVWKAEIDKQGEPARIEVLSWLGRMTLDVIGLAGFNYVFDALDVTKKPNELTMAFREIFDSSVQITIYGILRNFLPILQILPDKRAQRTDQAHRVMRKIGKQLIAEKKAAVVKELAGEKEDMERKDLQGRDLLTLLIKANMSTDIPEGQRLEDEDVLAQVPTFLVAGHETTSTATTWCLFALTQAPEVQRKLREELFTISTDTPSMDELMSLPYLDAVIRETLRVHAPVPATMRVATKDDDCIRISKDSPIIIPILAINRMKELWGEDSFEFKPERWESIPEAVSSIPGVWGHLLTFLGGPRSCIGYRFSLVEMKALVFTLVRAFEYELAPPSFPLRFSLRGFIIITHSVLAQLII